jgi:nucleotide-binding universal stress UspA family protein
MFQRIAVAYNESAEAQRALAAAIQLAKIMGAQLQTITVMADLPAYTAFAGIADPSLPRILDEDRIKFYEELSEMARKSAQDQGIDLLTNSVEGPAVEEIVRFLRDTKPICSLLGCTSKIFISLGSGARSTSSHRRLHAACLVFTSSPG